MDLIIDNNGLQVRQPVRTEKAQAASGTQSTAADADVQKTISLAHTTDRVEISAEGRAALAQSVVVSAEQTQEMQTSQEQTAQVAQAAQISQAAQTQPNQAPAVTAPSDEQSAAAATAVQAAEAAAETETSLESADTSSSQNLAMLTEQQIDDLVAAGTITRSEANAEIARRAAADDQQD